MITLQVHPPDATVTAEALLRQGCKIYWITSSNETSNNRKIENVKSYYANDENLQSKYRFLTVPKIHYKVSVDFFSSRDKPLYTQRANSHLAYRYNVGRLVRAVNFMWALALFPGITRRDIPQVVTFNWSTFTWKSWRTVCLHPFPVLSLWKCRPAPNSTESF